jgi:hypothetical protein
MIRLNAPIRIRKSLVLIVAYSSHQKKLLPIISSKKGLVKYLKVDKLTSKVPSTAYMPRCLQDQKCSNMNQTTCCASAIMRTMNSFDSAYVLTKTRNCYVLSDTVFPTGLNFDTNMEYNEPRVSCMKSCSSLERLPRRLQMMQQY